MSERISVVVATYNRPDSLVRILEELSLQSLRDFEVIVVDDGSRENVQSRVAAFDKKLRIVLHRQSNAGAAAARQRGAELASGELLIFVDDDMVLSKAFVAEHARCHEGSDKRVVMGRLYADEGVSKMPLFERFYAHMLDRVAGEVKTGKMKLRGPSLYTGNLSIRRKLFFQAGGFDPSFAQIEDAELGVRLESCGAEFLYSDEAGTIHASDHLSQDKWLSRSVTDGRFWARLSRKHPDASHASPWRFLTSVNPLSRPVLGLVVALPSLAKPLSRTTFAFANAADAIGFSRLALSGTTLVYGIQYFRGVREETGSIRDVLREYAAFRRGLREMEQSSPESLASAVRADFEALSMSQEKYGNKPKRDATWSAIGACAVTNIGFQLLIAYRVMRQLRSSGNGLGARFASRLIRHMYGSDIHWDATFEPGIVIVHGFGLAIHGDVYVSRGCILFQHVTLGRGLHPETKIAGSPHLEPNVHVGVGATVVGPVRIGERSKISPGCTVLGDVPPNSVVEAAAPTIRTRPRGP